MPRIKTKTRAQRDVIASEIRSEIVKGLHLPGGLLPTRADLLVRFQAAPATLQAAMDQLIEEGFVEVGAARHGSHVSEHPPHRFHYKLIFPPLPRVRTQYYVAIENEAQRIAAEGPQRLSFFNGIRGHEDIAAYQQLVNDVRFGRLAGLIFAISAEAYRGTPLLEEPGIPRFAFGQEGQLPGIPKIHFDYESFFARLARHLAQRGRRRPVFLCPSLFMGQWVDATILPALRAHQIDIPRYCIQFVDLWAPHAIRHALQLLLRASGDAPDAIIIADDNLVEPATQFLVEEGIRIPECCEVIAHCTFPWPTPCHVPAHRIGFNIRDAIAMGIDAIDRQRRGEPVPEFRSISAVFEEELATP